MIIWKGQKVFLPQKRRWSKDEKLKAVNRVLINHETAENVRKELNINSGLLHAWIQKYLNEEL